MLFTGCEIRIQKTLPEVSRPRAQFFACGPKLTVIDFFFFKSAAGRILAFPAIRLIAAAGGILRYLTRVWNPIFYARATGYLFCFREDLLAKL